MADLHPLGSFYHHQTKDSNLTNNSAVKSKMKTLEKYIKDQCQNHLSILGVSILG